MLKVIVVCLVIVFAGWVLSNPITYFRKECPTTRLYSEGTREVQRPLQSAPPLALDISQSSYLLRYG